MQHDTTAPQLLLRMENEDKKKQLQAFLLMRQQYRSGLSSHPPAERLVTVSTPSNDLTSTPQSAGGGTPQHQPPVSDDIGSKEIGHMTENQIIGAVLSDDTHGAKTPSQETQQNNSQVAFGVVVVCSNFRYLPSLADKTKDIANQLFSALTDSHFARFSRRCSKVLINPSLIEFQDTMKEIQALSAEIGEDAAFFMCLASHGARVTSGVNEGSYVLFCETRLSSEEELLLTALHENDLAKMIHDIPAKNKLLALELCQAKQSLEKPVDEATTIVNRIHEAFATRLIGQLIKLELASQQRKQPTLTEAQLLSTKPPLFNTVILESCNVKSESPVRCPVDNVSNFLHRLNDAFHGAAANVSLGGGSDPDPRGFFRARDICTYVQAAVERDANAQNESVKAEYNKQLRTKYELVAQFEDITHTPQVLGLERLEDFRIGNIPAAPELSPSPPVHVSATTSSVTLSWEAGFGGFHPTTSIEVPTILGFHVEIRGFDLAFREKMPSPTQTTAYGLPSDAAFRFRIRARTAGGWGPFSDESCAIRTLSRALVHDTFSTVASVFTNRGVAGLLEMMQTNEHNRDVLRTGIEFLSRVSGKDGPDAWYSLQSRSFPTELVAPVVSLTVRATEKFASDGVLARHACLLVGRLAESNGLSRKAILSIRDPHQVRDILEQWASRFATTRPDTHSAAIWAGMKLRGVSGRYRMNPEAAANRIQGLYRTRKAREYMRSLTSNVYTQLVDPSTGLTYVFNTKTGTTSWSLPRFLGS